MPSGLVRVPAFFSLTLCVSVDVFLYMDFISTSVLQQLLIEDLLLARHCGLCVGDERV